MDDEKQLLRSACTRDRLIFCGLLGTLLLAAALSAWSLVNPVRLGPAVIIFLGGSLLVLITASIGAAVVLFRRFALVRRSDARLRLRLGGSAERLAQETAMRNKVEEVLKRRERKYQAIIESSSNAIAILDDKGIILYISGAVKTILGWSPDELVGTDLFTLINPDERVAAKNNFLVNLDEGESTFSVEFRIRTKSGEWVHCAADGNNLLENPLIGGVIFNIRDVSRLKTAEEQAEFFQYYDPLTRLPNRQKFLSRIQFEINRAQYRNKVFAVMCLGIDKLKHINEVHGTQAGDDVLKKVGKDLTMVFREDDLVSRSRSDKFLILLADISDSDRIGEVIQKAQRAVAEPIIFENAAAKITCSIGVALYPHDGITQDALINASETAMYLAKESGRNTYRLFDADMNHRILDRMKVEDELAEAIRDNAFSILYQPKVTREGRLAGAEALVRWQLPDGRVRSPDSFIPIAERNGSIVEIGALILRSCCVQTSIWRKEGLPATKIAVNLSPYQFMHADLIPSIRSTLLQTGVSPAGIELEITESGIMEDEKDSIQKLNELHDMGFTLAVDDFGTGYSSFSKLKDYPIDTLKIDKSFIASIPGDVRAEKITAAIVDLAHNLSFTVVAEGVENEAQIEFLERLRCDEYQGFYFSRPLPAGRFQERLKTGISLPSMNHVN